MSNAPTYQGTDQPALSQSTGWLGKLLGQGEAPAYQGTGQPVLRTAGIFASAAPVYRQAPAMQPVEGTREEDTLPDCMNVARAALVYSEDCEPLAKGPIAIIVPRQG